MDEPTTPAALPRNREADEWRLAAVIVLAAVALGMVGAFMGLGVHAAQLDDLAVEERSRPIVLPGQNIQCGARACGVIVTPAKKVSP